MSIWLISPVTAADSAPRYHSISTIDSVFAPDSSFHGNVVYVDFWASWCPPCRSSMPWMKGLAARYDTLGFKIATINLDKDPSRAVKFLAELDCDFRVFFDTAGTLARMFAIEAMPTSFLYDRSGELQSRHLGFRTEDTVAVDSTIRALLAEDAQE